MAPGRKRGGKGIKTKNELRLGDLVLAKVKGFPAWPAKISRPEDCGRAPDPKKYFVRFFGTLEIAFVAPADIQAFTSESKNKLCARQGKSVRHFAQAVKEICEEFDMLQRKTLTGIRDDNNAQNLASVTHSDDPVVSESVEVSDNSEMDSEEPNCKLEIKELNDLGPEHSSQRLGEMDCRYVKPCLSGDKNRGLSPHLSSGRRNKLSTNPTNLVRESVVLSSPSGHALVRDESSRDVKVEGQYLDGSQIAMTNDLQTKLAMRSKRKHDSAMGRNSDSVVSRERIGDGLQIKLASGSNMKVLSADISRPDLDVGSERKGKKLLKEKKHSEAVDNAHAEVIFEDHNEVISRKKMKFQHDHGNQTSRTNGASFPSKMDNIESKKFQQPSSNESKHSTDEDDFHPIKRHRLALGVMSSSTSISENRPGNPASHKTGLAHPNKVQSPTTQPPMKRRAVRLCQDKDDELPKTPIHAGFTRKVTVVPRVSDPKKKNVQHEQSHTNDQVVMKNLGRVGEHVQFSRDKASSPPALQSFKKRTTESSAEHVSRSPSPPQLATEKTPIMEAKPVSVSPKRSPHSVSATRPVAESQKKHFSKVPDSISPKKVLSGANRGLDTASDRLTSSLSQSVSERSKPTSSGERRKTTPKSDSQINDPVLMVGNPDDSSIATFGERMDVCKETQTSFPVDLTISDSGMSMKHLIAAAQARKRQANLQNSYGNPLPFIPDADMPRRSPSLIPATSAVESINSLQFNAQGHPTSPPPPPSHDVRPFSSVNEHENEDLEERRASSGHQATGSSLSGGTEAAVARDAFEGMIETLSRTKESIGRATRLAIDCAKYGIAHEIVELLIQKLEREPSFHRKVDLFFLVDSITQCSHSQKGIAGASYIPTVQVALPRLIGAAAPSGTGAQENRRQCHKVLRLWLERKILPESVLRPYMDDVGAINDGSSAGVSVPQRRPSRAERAIDDPIREMEGMFVDEYGSNATFQLPGLLSSHLFEEEEEEEEDEDDFPIKSCKEVTSTPPCQHTPASKDSENYTVTPSDRRHCILEEVDGELEMEDVSGHQKDERLLIANGTSVVALLDPNSEVVFGSSSNISALLPSPEGSPPLPPGSPPETPPLPTSPPPLSPPPPPPPSSSPSPPPPPPPPPSSEQNSFPPPPVDPPLFPQSFPPQPALMSQYMLPLPSTMPISQPLAYHPLSVHRETGDTPTGNQVAHMVSYTQGSHISAPISSEVFSHQSSFFSPAAVSNKREPASYNSLRVKYGQGDACMNTLASQQKQQFLPVNSSFACPEPPQISSHFSYSSSVQQYRPYSLPVMPLNDFNADRRSGGWMNGGYYGPPPERAPANAVNFKPPLANSLPGAPSVRGVPMMPSRPDISAVNRRPA
ncbi:hypothetical protein ACS0TY_011255 [Phlomoides rotata]